MEEHDGKKDRLPQVITRAGGVLAAGFGILALTGWVLGLPLLASLGKGWIPMAPSSALLFALYGTTLFLSSRKPLSLRAHRICMVIGSAGTLVALLLFFLSNQGIYTNIEHLGVPISGTVKGAPVGHMSPVTEFCFVLAGLSFLTALYSSPGRSKLALAALGVAYATILISFVLLLAYLFGTPLFYGADIIPPAFSTALAFIALGTSLAAFVALQVYPRGKPTEVLTTQASHILVLIFAVVSVGIVTAGYFYYRVYEKHYRLEVTNQLAAIAELKTNGIVHYRRERLENASRISKNLSLANLIGQFFKNPDDAAAKKALMSWIINLQSNYQYDSVFLLDMRGVARMSLPGEAQVDPIILQQASDALRSRQVVFQDFYRDNHARRIYLAILVPVLDGKDGDRPVGVLVLRIDPEEYLYPFITRLSTASPTAETVLIRREGNEAVFLNELRFRKNTALNRRVPLDRKEIPVVQAVLGFEGAISGRDPRGISFIAYVRAIPDSPLFLVARTDVTEVSAPLRERLWIVVALVIALLSGSGMSIGFIWQGQKAQFYRERYAATEKLIESEARYRSLASTADAMYLVDRHGRYLFMNEGFLKRFGLSADQLIGKTYDDFHTAENTANFSMKVEEVFKTGNSVQLERQSPRDGRHFLQTFSPVKDNEGNVITAVTVVAKDITARKRAEEELRTSRQQLRALAVRQQRIREEARITISREIHDELGGGLTGLKMDLSWLLNRLSDAGAGAEQTAFINRVHTSNTLVDHMIRVVRRIATELRPPALDDLGLIAALEWQLEEFTSRTEIPHELATAFEEINLEKAAATAVFRVFQEALTNVTRHAAATKVTVLLREENGSLILEIRDNGRGIREDEILDIRSLGILGMKERTLAFGGELRISGEPEGGTTVILKIPLKQGETPWSKT